MSDDNNRKTIIIVDKYYDADKDNYQINEIGHENNAKSNITSKNN